MHFYQQKYFRPYHLARDCIPQPDSPLPRAPSFRAPSLRALPSFRAPPPREDSGEEPIWDHLYKEGVRLQKELLQRHQDNKLKIDTECTFQPILTPSGRYLVPSHSTFLERVHVWQEHKIEKMVREKEGVVNQGLRQCTFAPKINVRRENAEKQGWRNRQSRENLTQHKTIKERGPKNPLSSPPKRKVLASVSPIKDTAKHLELDHVKRIIRTELKKMVL